MLSNLQQTLKSALLRLLRPLARVMLNHGMAYGDFAELARKAFVDEGFEYLRRSGRRPTISGVSALTGLTRKEAKRLQEESLAEDADTSQRYNRATRVISGWVEDGSFHDDQGEPAILPLEGDEGSFAALVKKYSGDIPVAAMLSVLQNSQTVAVDGDRIELLQRAYIPMSTPVDKLNILGTDVAQLISTIGHNLEAEPGDRLFQRKVSSNLIRPEAISAFREFSSKRSQHLLEEYDHWLSEHEIDAAEKSPKSGSYVAVGIYFTDQSHEEESND